MLKQTKISPLNFQYIAIIVGRRGDIIIISLVRSNDEGQIGFLRDLRRMNVAITRARMKLIILGDRETMTRHTFYRQLWQYIENLRG